MALMGLIVLALILGMLIPQLPPEAVGSSQAWLATQTGPAYQQNGLVRTLRLYDLFHTLGFRTLLALVALCLFARGVEAFELAWSARTWRRQRREPGAPEGSLAWGRRVLKSAPIYLNAEAARRLGDRLHQGGYWLSTLGDSRASGYVAGRRSALLWAPVVGYAGLLLAILGLVITDTWGWLGEQWQPQPGESRAVGQGTLYALRLDRFDVQVNGGGRLCACSSQVTWLEGDVELGTDAIRIGQPASRPGVAVRQLGFVPIVRMRGWDGDGRPLALETDADALSVTGVAEIRFTTPESQPLVLVSGHDLFLALSFEPNCATGTPALHLTRIEAGGAGRREVGVLYESGSILADGLRLDIDLDFLPVLRSDFRPGQGVAVAGLALAIAAGLVLWCVPPRLVWIREEEEEANQSVLEVRALAGFGDSLWWVKLRDDLEEALIDEA
jgi:hypothetical protein